jgi:hypothetical protein
MPTIEVLQRNAAIGLRFWDMAAATSAVDGLRVEIFPRRNPNARKRALPGPSGIYVAHNVSGLRDFEFEASAPSDPVDAPWRRALDASPPIAAGYRVEVSDPQGRFLPIAFDAELPARGVSNWLAPWISPPQPIALPGASVASPQMLIERIPLFSAPSRPVPEPLAVVYAQLRDTDSGQAAGWSLLAVNIDGIPVGLGMADAQGRVAVMFPYPEPPRAPLFSPPEARSDFRWVVDLTAFCTPASPTVAAPDIPDLAEVLGQLAAPCTVIDAMSSPAALRRLEYRVPMTAKTEGQPEADASWLLISTA